MAERLKWPRGPKWPRGRNGQGAEMANPMNSRNAQKRVIQYIFFHFTGFVTLDQRWRGGWWVGVSVISASIHFLFIFE